MLKCNNQLAKVMLKIGKIQYGSKLKLLGWPFVFRFPKAQIIIGNNVTINSNFFSNLLGLYQRTIVVAKNNSRIIIGNNVGISGATIYSWKSIIIGDNTLVGANVKIVDNDFHPIDPEARKQKINEKTGVSPVTIGNNVFIGMNTLILKGAEIGDNCVVGAGAVVTGKFPNNCIICGNPARIVKKIPK